VNTGAGTFCSDAPWCAPRRPRAAQPLHLVVEAGADDEMLSQAPATSCTSASVAAGDPAVDAA